MKILYEKRLHAKYYANEKFGLITSINLHSYSMNNNIEVGVGFQMKSTLKSLTDKALNGVTSIISNTENIAEEADMFFENIHNNAVVIFDKEPRFETNMFGFQKKYTQSEIMTDGTDKFFQELSKMYVSKNYNNNNEGKSDFRQKPYGNNYSNQQNNNNHSGQRNNNNYSNQRSNNNSQRSGYCIRTREKIPLDGNKPLGREPYFVWAEYSNPDFGENYCHSCGRDWGTSVRNPFCNNCGF